MTKLSAFIALFALILSIGIVYAEEHQPFGELDRLTGFPFSDEKVKDLENSSRELSLDSLPSFNQSETPLAALDRLLELTPYGFWERRSIRQIARTSMEEVEAERNAIALLGDRQEARDVDLVSDEFEAGSASVDMTPRGLMRGCPLGGTGSRHKTVPLTPDPHWEDPMNLAKWQFPSKGIHDPIRAKAIALRAKGKIVLFISTDLVGVSEMLVDKLGRALVPWGVTRNQIVLSGTHNHSGPGGMADAPWFWFTATDFFDQRVFDFTFNRVFQAAVKAIENLQPAEVAMASCRDTHSLTYNLRDNPHMIDPEIGTITVRNKESHAPIATLFNFAIHVNAIKEKLRSPFFSADISGVVERELEDRFEMQGKGRPVAMHFNGAEGDIDPKASSYEEMTRDGRLLAEDVWSCDSDGKWEQKMDLRIRNMPLEFPHGPYMRPGLLEAWIPNWITIPVGALVWKEGWLSAVAWNDTVILTYPGEPIAEIGLFTKQKLRDFLTYKHNWLFGLSQGYIAYNTTEEEYWKGGYQAAATLWGPKQWELIDSKYSELMSRLPKERQRIFPNTLR